ncbi:MAG: pyridoxal 5'-phosphate synthase glutaminase subunit PdxT [Chloroflexi bacterium]|nr:pyridoxal 5'-phosphate synthase glutaminase subunit PdxT [Chloroflexota bacterium]
MVTRGLRVGVLALQGDFEEHEVALRRIGAQPVQVRTEAQLLTADSLIIPGGESTSMANLMDTYALREPLIAFARSGKPVWGTCAGLIMLSSKIQENRPEPLGLMDIVVARNGFGRQVDSFEINLAMVGLDGPPFHAIFIRAPKVVEVGPSVEVLARLDDGTIVAARQEHMLVTAFHPELTADDRIHRMFVALSSDVATS